MRRALVSVLAPLLCVPAVARATQEPGDDRSPAPATPHAAPVEPEAPDAGGGAGAGGPVVTWAAITLRSVRPAVGPIAGGTAITIRGRGFRPGCVVRIGGRPATEVSVVSSRVITAVTPAGATPGAAEVEVGCLGITASAAGAFAYEVWDYDLNDIVLAPLEVENTLKGHRLVVDDTAGLAYVAGIKTDGVAVVDLTTRRLVRNFELSEHDNTVKYLRVDEAKRRLWVVAPKNAAYLWLVDLDSESLIAERDIQAELGASTTYPVQALALDPTRDRLYLKVWTGSVHGVFVYDSALAHVDTILAGYEIVDMRWDLVLDALVVLESPFAGGGDTVHLLPAGDESRITSVAPATATSFDYLALDAGGDFYLAGGLAVARIDGLTGGVVWTASAPYRVYQLEVSGSEVGVLQKYGDTSLTGAHLSRVTTFDRTSGSLIATRPARFEAESMDASPALGGFVVANGGDASVTILAPGTVSGLERKVGTSAEQGLLTADGTRLLVRTRLGGSLLSGFELGSGVGSTLATEDWPAGMVVTPTKLYVYGHFSGRVVIYDPDSLSSPSAIPLGLAPTYSDTLGDMVASQGAGLLVVLAAQLGQVVILDGASDSVRTTVTIGPELVGGGPGRMSAAVDDSDPTNRRVFLYFRDDDRLYRLDESAGFALLSAPSVPVAASGTAKSAYPFGSVFYSPLRDELFVWNARYDPDMLTHEDTLTGVERIVGESDTLYYAQRAVDLGTYRDEYLVEVDPGSHAATGERVVTRTESNIASTFSVYPSHNRLVFTNPVRSEVHVTHLVE